VEGEGLLGDGPPPTTNQGSTRVHVWPRDEGQDVKHHLIAQAGEQVGWSRQDAARSFHLGFTKSNTSILFLLYYINIISRRKSQRTNEMGKSKRKSHYAVARGRNVGIYRTWYASNSPYFTLLFSFKYIQMNCDLGGIHLHRSPMQLGG
jgi:hypothetical protein